MSVNKAVALLKQVIEMLTGEVSIGSDPSKYPPVFDLQPLGYTKVGAVEAIRDEFSISSEPLKRRFATSLPVWWYLQDAENYLDMSEEQKSLQEFNCGNARFTLSVNRQNTGGETGGRTSLWRMWIPAVKREWQDADEVAYGRWVDTPLVHSDGKPVYAVSNDSNIGRHNLTTNPRVHNMDEVIRLAYEYFYERNKNAVNDPNTAFPSS